MPKYYCDYCDIYLTHSSAGGRRQHNSGRKHINNKIEYMTAHIRDKMLTPPIYPVPPHLVDAIRPNMPGRPMTGGMFPMGIPGSFPGFPGAGGKLGLPPGMSGTARPGPFSMRPPIIRAPILQQGNQLPPQDKLPPQEKREDNRERGWDDDSRDGYKGKDFKGKGFKGKDFSNKGWNDWGKDFNGKGKGKDFDDFRDRGDYGDYGKGKW